MDNNNFQNLQAQTRSLSPQAAKTTATANSSFRSSTDSTRHSSGVRFPPRRLPALRTSPLGPGPLSILSQRSLTQQLPKEWPQYKALRQRYAGTRFEEHRQLHLPQKHKATVPDSTLRIEMNGLEKQADNAQARDLQWNHSVKRNSGAQARQLGRRASC